MKYSVLGFSQEKVIKHTVLKTWKDKKGEEHTQMLKCDLSDLMILNYIIQANASSKMQHYVDKESGKVFVWIDHTTLLENLPILDIQSGTLRNKLMKLRELKLIESITLANGGGQGTKTFYSITSLCDDMIFDWKENTSQKNDMKEEPHHEKSTSNNKLQKDSTLKNNISSKEDILTENFDFGKKENKPRKTKNNLYTKCSAMIYNFTDIPALRKLLFTWLDMRLEIKDKPMYANQFKGILNKLDKLSDSATVLCEIVQQSIDRCYLSFFPLSYGKSQKQSTHDAIHESGSGVVINDTKEDAEKREQFRAKMEAEGKKAVF